MPYYMTLCQAREVLRPFIPAFVGALKVSVQNWNSRPPVEHQVLDEIVRGAIIAQYWYYYAGRFLEDEPRAQFQRNRGQRFFAIAQTIIIRIKHVNEDNLSKNYPTARSINWNRQLPLPGVPLATRLEFAYKMDLTGTTVERACVLLRIADSIIWMWQIWGERHDIFSESSEDTSQDLFQRDLFSYEDFSLAEQEL